jgi:hypothetical protein
MHLRYPPAQVSPLDGVTGQGKRTFVFFQSGVPVTRPTEQVSSGGMIQVIGVELSRRSQPLDQNQPLVNAFAHRDGDGLI